MTDPAPTGHVRIPGYEIRKEIGRGGVATVYLAIQESLDREVALKIMSPALAAEPNFTERFIREGSTIARITHPGIVTIYDISVAEYQHYIAMEYLPSGSLKQRMHKPIAPGPALVVLRQVTAALGFAHSKGFVHRDVKPENIIFRDPNTAVLTDFGIAKQTSDSDTHLTSIGVIVGTPRYMSPEQADGRGTDPRSDIYALGILLYEMLTGRPPFEAKESIALLYSHINDPIPELPAEVASLQPLVNDLMAKDPAQRVQDCQELLERIKRLQRDVKETGKHTITPAPTTPAGSATVRTGKRKPLRREPDGVWNIVAWTGIALATTFIAAAVIRGLMEDDNIPGETTATMQSEPVATSANGAERAATPPVPLPVPTPEPAGPTPGVKTESTSPPGSSPAPRPVAAHPVVVPEVVMPPAKSTVQASPAAKAPGQNTASKEVPGTKQPGPEVTAPASATSKATANSEQERGRVAAGTGRTPVQTSKTTTERGWVLADDEKIQELLQRADSQFEQERLSHPPGDNAMESYQAILKLAPGQPQAMAGLQRVADRYLRLAQQVFAQKKFNSALAYIERGLAAVPEHPELGALQVTVKNRIRADKDFAAAEKYFYGKGVSKDLPQAMELYQSAADKGHVTAQFHLAVVYGNGLGVEPNEREALRWLQVAASQGNYDAQYNLGLGLLFGPNRDAKAAARWIMELAERNYEPAFRVLGWMYTTGTGVEHSINQSIRWVAKGVISKPIGPPSRPDWLIDKWQRQFDAVYLRDVSKETEEPT